MKKQVLNLLIVAGVLSVTLIYSCKKSESTTSGGSTSGTYSTANNATFNDDANMYKSENDQLNSDINTDVTSNGAGLRLGADADKFQSYYPPCDVNVDLSQIGQKKIIYHFNGISCDGFRKRTGTVTVQLTSGTHWVDPGAVLTISTSDFTVTRIWTGKSVTLSGTKTLKNVNGTDYFGFLAGTKTIKIQERAIGVNVTFSGGAHATWNSAYVGEWSFTPSDSIIYVSATGDTSVNGFNNVGAWGVNRFNQAFNTYYDLPVVWDSYCGSWKPLSGIATHSVDNSTLTLTLGTDTAGVHHAYYTAKNCPWGFNLTWHFGNGSNGSANLPYN